MEILDALLEIEEQAVNGCVEHPDCGICYNLTVITEESDLSYYFVKDNCCDWQNFSGCTSYPISPVTVV